MLGGQLRQLPGCRAFRPACSQRRVLHAPVHGRRLGVTVLAVDGFKNFFGKLKGGGGAGEGQGKGGDDAARRALQDTFGNQKRFGIGQDKAQQGGGGGSGFGGFGGGGGGSGGSGFGGSAPEGNEGPERSVRAEIWEAFTYSWSVFWNLALFLVFADVLHRSLDWCCGVELLFLVGAPQQAFERLAGRFFAAVEWLEKNLLGWDIPGEEDMIPMYENLKLFYPRAHAFSFDQYRYNLAGKEKELMVNAYALRHYEREGGYAGDVDPADVRALRAKYEPLEADRQEYLRAKAANRLEEYWATHRGMYERMTGQRFVRPPGMQAPAAAAVAR